MELKKRNLSDNGIRLKPNKPNLLENYSKVRKRTRKKKKKKKDKSKTIEIQKKIDPIDKLIQNLNRKETKIEDIEIKDKKDKKDIKIEEINNQVEENKNIKKLTITASTKPDKKKTGSGFLIE
tara:strand:- start:44 stop:412 length:369 start_codon:yes stop_codon:yes gene_type:complete